MGNRFGYKNRSTFRLLLGPEVERIKYTAAGRTNVYGEPFYLQRDTREYPLLRKQIDVGIMHSFHRLYRYIQYTTYEFFVRNLPTVLQTIDTKTVS